jgi:hypothetical protein
VSVTLCDCCSLQGRNYCQTSDLMSGLMFDSSISAVFLLFTLTLVATVIDNCLFMVSFCFLNDVVFKARIC